MYKTWKAAHKRIKKTKNKKILKKQAGVNHFNTKKKRSTLMSKRKKKVFNRPVKDFLV